MDSSTSLELIVDKEGFRISNQRLLLIYRNVKNPWTKQELEEFFKLKNHGYETIVYITEKHDEDAGGTYYVAVDFCQSFLSRRRYVFDYDV